MGTRIPYGKGHFWGLHVALSGGYGEQSSSCIRSKARGGGLGYEVPQKLAVCTLHCSDML